MGYIAFWGLECRGAQGGLVVVTQADWALRQSGILLARKTLDPLLALSSDFPARLPYRLGKHDFLLPGLGRDYRCEVFLDSNHILLARILVIIGGSAFRSSGQGFRVIQRV